MIRPYLPLNALRAFEAAARHLSFTNAAIELCVTPAALSHQVKALEARLGATLFRRLPRGLALTDEGHALLPVLSDAFDRIAGLLQRFEGGVVRAVLTLGKIAHDSTVRTFGARLADHPFGHGARTEIGGIGIVSSYHCSRYNTNTGRLPEAMFRDAFAAASRAARPTADEMARPDA